MKFFNREPRSTDQQKSGFTGLEALAGKFNPAAAKQAKQEKQAQAETPAEQLERHEQNILNQNILGDEAKERDFIDRIAGNWQTKSGSVERVMDSLNTMHEQKILAFMTGMDPNGYQQMDAESLRAFVQENPSPIDFEAKADDFLQRIEDANGRPKRDQYAAAMANFKHKVYGKKQEYYEALKDLKAQAAEKYGATAEILSTERRMEWVPGVGHSVQVSREQVKSGQATRTNIYENLKASETCEDTALIKPERDLYGVFDGVGGELNGREASQLAARTIADLDQKYALKSGRDLAWALNQASAAIAESSKAGYSTGVLTKLIDDGEKPRLAWASAGDSRLYLVAKNGDTRQVTTDEGDGRGIWNGLGFDQDPGNCTRQFGDLELNPGDRVVICSDGVTGDKGAELMSDAEIGAIVQKAYSAEYAAKDLVAQARKTDDRTAIVFQGA